MALQSSWAIYQDMIDFIACSTTTQETFKGRKELINFMYSLDKGESRDCGSVAADCFKIAITLRQQQEKVIDLTSPQAMNNLISLNPLPIHRLYLSQLVGYITAMNARPPQVSDDEKKPSSIHLSYELPAYDTLKNISLHKSKTYVIHALSLIYKILEYEGKSSRLQGECKTTCSSSVCCLATCNVFCSKLSIKQLAKSSSKNNNAQGFEYACLTEYPSNACYIGNTSLEKSEVNEINSHCSNQNKINTVNSDIGFTYSSSYLQAAIKTVDKYKSYFKLTSDSEPECINQIFRRTVDIFSYIQKEKHGLKLLNRQARHNKLEMEIKESLKPFISYMGTFYMTIRKSGIMRLASIVILELKQHTTYKKMHDCNQYLRSLYYGSFMQNKTFTEQIDTFSMNVGDPYKNTTATSISCRPTKQNIVVGQSLCTKSSNKLKSLCSFFLGNDSDGPENDNRNNSVNVVNVSLGLKSSKQKERKNVANAFNMDSRVLEKIMHTFFSVLLPNLRRYSDKEKCTSLMAANERMTKIEKLLKHFPGLYDIFASMDDNLQIHNWGQFVDKFVPCCILQKYNFIPTGYGDGKSIGKHTFFQLYQIKNDRQEQKPSKITNNGHLIAASDGLKFVSDMVNSDIFQSQALLINTRICLVSFETSKGQKVVQAKIAKSDDNTACITTDTKVSIAPQSGFAVPLRGAREMNTDFSLKQFVFEINYQPTAVAQIQYIHGHANILYSALCTQMGVENPEDLNTTEAISFVDKHDPERYTMIGCIRECFENIFTNYYSNKEEYEQTYLKILQKCMEDESYNGVRYVDDVDFKYDSETEDDEVDGKVKENDDDEYDNGDGGYTGNSDNETKKMGVKRKLSNNGKSSSKNRLKIQRSDNKQYDENREYHHSSSSGSDDDGDGDMSS